MSLTNHTKRRTAHSRVNPIPFRERVYTPKKEAARFCGIGLRKITQLISEGALDSVVIGKRRLIVVESLLRCLQAGLNGSLPEPVGFQTAHTAPKVAP